MPRRYSAEQLMGNREALSGELYAAACRLDPSYAEGEELMHTWGQSHDNPSTTYDFNAFYDSMTTVSYTRPM